MEDHRENALEAPQCGYPGKITLIIAIANKRQVYLFHGLLQISSFIHSNSTNIANADLQAFVAIPLNEFRKQPDAWNRTNDLS